MALDKLVDSAVLDANLTTVADAIRAKGGTSESMEFPAGFVSAVEGISAGGGQWTTEGIIAGTEPNGDIVSNASVILKHSFSGKPITSAKMSNIVEVSDGAFESCLSLESVDLPNVQTISFSAFSGCTKLSKVNCPNVTLIKSTAFLNCSALQEVELPNLLYLKDPSSGTNGTRCFGNSGLTKVILPKIKEIKRCCFEGCKSLAYADLGDYSAMLNGAFSKCTSLKTLVIRCTKVTHMEVTGCLANTPIQSGGTGYIYVPRALLSDDDASMDFRRATNWSTYASQFRALEDYTVDGTTTGELDWDKIEAEEASA